MAVAVAMAAGSAVAQQDRRSRIDVDHYTIDADINLKAQSITAKVAVKFTPLDDRTQYATFELNGALNVSKVTDDKGTAVSFSRSNQDNTVRLTFDPPLAKSQPVTLVFTYDGHLTGTGTVSHNLRDICLGLITYYEHLVPLTASFFADTDLLVRFRGLLQRIGGPERLHDHIAAYIEMEQRQGRIASELSAFSFAALLLGPLFQYAFLRKLMDNDPFGTTDRDFVESLLQTLAPLIVPSEESGT